MSVARVWRIRDGGLLTACVRSGSGFAQQLAKQVFCRFARLERKGFLEELELIHPIGAEEPEIVAQFAPRTRHPEWRIKPQGERAHRAPGLGALFVMITETNFLVGANCASQTAQIE